MWLSDFGQGECAGGQTQWLASDSRLILLDLAGLRLAIGLHLLVHTSYATGKRTIQGPDRGRPGACARGAGDAPARARLLGTAVCFAARGAADGGAGVDRPRAG